MRRRIEGLGVGPVYRQVKRGLWRIMIAMMLGLGPLAGAAPANVAPAAFALPALMNNLTSHREQAGAIASAGPAGTLDSRAEYWHATIASRRGVRRQGLHARGLRSPFLLLSRRGSGRQAASARPGPDACMAQRWKVLFSIRVLPRVVRRKPRTGSILT